MKLELILPYNITMKNTCIHVNIYFYIHDIQYWFDSYVS